MLLSPRHAVDILVWFGVVMAVLMDGRFAYFLLPISVPWGSLFSASIGSASVTPSDLIVGALLLTFLVGLAQSRVKAPAPSIWVVSVGILLLAMVISAVGAISIEATLPELAKWTEVLIVAALAPTFIRTSRDIELIMAAVIASAFTEAVFGIGQFLTHAGPKAFDIHHTFLRAYGTFGQPNPLAGYLNLVLPLSAALSFAKRSLVLWGATLVIGIGTAVTLSRGGWVAGILAVLAVSLIFCVWLRPLVVLGVLAVPIYALFTSLGLASPRPLTRAANDFGLTGINFNYHTHANFSEIERAAHWVAGLRMFEAHPFTGVGIGNYAVAYPSYHVANFLNPLGHAHNYFINIAAEAGILGLLAFTLFVVVGVASSVAAIRNFPPNSIMAILGIGALGLWISSTVHNLFDVVYVHDMPVLIAVIMGALFAAAQMADHRPIFGGLR